MSAQIAAGPLAWGALLAFLILMIAVDLRVGSARRSMTVRAAAIWSSIWIVLHYGLGVLLIGIAGKLAYGEATGEKVATSVTLGSIVAVLSFAIGASLIKERRAPTLRPLNEVT